MKKPLLFLWFTMTVLVLSETPTEQTKIFCEVYGGDDTKIERTTDSYGYTATSNPADNMRVLIEEPTNLEPGKRYDLKIYIGARFNPNIIVKEYVCRS